ncbi:globin domain-containing protein [Nocardia sp. CNY236]|uniref:globin domain-containing protein n=1 Tax=Nocardia sp. CNY236 TaxID=1169152 RepID=UPI0004218673|nr:globin domain-containing protein [Nocardia sp. CNY236]
MNTDDVVRAEPELEPRNAEVVRTTLPAVVANLERIATVFYHNMFTAHPELLRETFNRGNQANGTQQQALAASVAMYAKYLSDPALPHPATMLSRIAHKHASVGIVADQYQIVHDNLLGAIAEVLGDAVDESVAAAWSQVYWLMADTLIDQEKGLYADAGVDAGDVFRDARVRTRVDDPSGVAVFTVESADPDVEFPGFEPGQYISVGVRLPDGARQLRQYSLIGLPGTGTLSFAVKRVKAEDGFPAGEVSTWLHENVQTGDSLQITLPFGDVTVDTEATTPLILISGGIGATPMIGVLEYLAERSPGRRTVIVHADRRAQTHPLRDRMLELAAELEQPAVEIWYEESTPGAREGRVDLSVLNLPADADAYVCGPPGFLLEMQRQLRSAGVPQSRMHLEQFTPGDAGAPERVAR